MFAPQTRSSSPARAAVDDSKQERANQQHSRHVHVILLDLDID
jgi:hypothetical protein